ncbi:uncharacterized protein F4822DRAFT_212853 [Hypoxylon trugodes]|uniref:uncharacterized protein n=1 Tax=Hypoxylon trugodes TaxID=326681 RepID=UPI00219D3BD4|nr:uncharacterized protein F4822DRAFT_212853 [Hypoxylon trugodes]KAI1389770.1 hypothetical protein F4822DRAFT_212853 [Hypoxylon trugodes]
MKFSIAAVAFAAGVSASYPASNATQYTTEVVTSYETYCPGPTQITYGTNTYTVTEATTLTITDCPCTVSKPVYTTSSVSCATCAPAPVYPTSAPAYPTSAPPVYSNSSASATTPTQVYPTGGAPGTTTSATTIPTAGAGKVAALSGAGLAGLLGLAVAAL